MHKVVILIILILLTHCQRNPVVKTHGVAFLEKKEKTLIINETNKNDVKKMLGPPSATGAFENNTWIYIERTISRGKLLKFGQNITAKNNVLALEFNKYGILEKKDFYDKRKIKNVNFVKDTTDTVERERSFVYNFLSSLRQKINSPVKKK